MKLKDFKFKCTRLGMRDYNGYTHVMDLYDLYDNYIYGLKYTSGLDKEDFESKHQTKLSLIKYIKENEQKIYDYILARRTRKRG